MMRTYSGGTWAVPVAFNYHLSETQSYAKLLNDPYGKVNKIQRRKKICLTCHSHVASQF